MGTDKERIMMSLLYIATPAKFITTAKGLTVVYTNEKKIMKSMTQPLF